MFNNFSSLLGRERNSSIIDTSESVQTPDAFSLKVAGTFIATSLLFEMAYGKKVKQPRLKGTDLLYLFEISRLLRMILEGRANSGGAYLITKIIDPELKRPTQIHPNWGEKERFEWFIQKIKESIMYLKFQIARDAFNEALKDLPKDRSFALVLARINNHTCDVEAHVYSLRAVSILVKAIAKELEEFASSFP